ncbi:MAG: hypothetical protein METHAR1v1_150004 [Methanothrix sp.]|nr:MAG: hypothetical protein METHAR1v1_150004 [Methanothrix sp.]
MAALAVRLFFHQVSGVLEHDLAEVFGGGGRVDLPGEPFLDEEGDSPAVVDVGMGEEQRLQRAGIMPEPPPVPIGIAPLKEACIHPDPNITGFEHGVGSRNAAGRPVELKLHEEVMGLFAGLNFRARLNERWQNGRRWAKAGVRRSS